MALKISTWGAQGQPWWLHVVGEARTNHKEWLDMTPRDKARSESRYDIGEPFPSCLLYTSPSPRDS
eukprot:11904440-Prorocentrum_lima.AAC.1